MGLAHDITKGDRTRDVKISENITFETMLLAPATLLGLKSAGFYKPSPIQLYGIPIGKCGFDLLLEAKSGTGKTAVFSIIALEKLDFTKGLQVVILTPTREIAAQIYDVIQQIGSKYKDLKIEVVMGGLPFHEDILKFQETVHIVVASPGRFKHLIQENHVDTSAVRLLVLDEADKLMEKSFHSDIRYIHTVLPKQKQVIMSSATYSDSARNFINNYVQNANHVCPDSDTVLLGISQKVSFVKYNNNIVRHIQDRFKELLEILAKIQFKQCLVFCNYQARVSEVHKMLKKEKWPSQQLSGQQEQVDRLDALKTLQQYKCRILVSTDLAARGIDASNIDLVINFEPPYEWQTYLHRIGRAGRFGSYGLAITILSEGTEEKRFRDMFKSMELSIKMYNLWTGAEFNLDSSIAPTKLTKSPPNDPKPSMVLNDEVDHEAIWEVLSNQSDNIHILESFENLCKSHEKTENQNIETFSDLIISAKNFRNSEDKVLFKHLEMKQIPSLKLSTKQKHMNILNDVSENNSILENKTIKTNYTHATTETLDNETEKNESRRYSDDTNVNFKELKDNVKNNIERIGDKTTTKDRYEVNTLEHEPCNMNDSMLALGLPTTFSSSKTRSNAQKKEKNKSFAQNQNNNYGNKFCSKTKNIQTSKTKVTTDMFNNNHNCKDSGNSHNVQNSQPVTKIKNICRSNVFNSDRNKNIYDKDFKPDTLLHQTDSVQNNNNIQNHTSFFQEKDRIERHKRKTYIDWYKQLKFNMKHIEQAIYIDEMSRL